MQRGAIILCGGQSTRMGHDKASLLFGAETMLERVTRIVSEVVARENIVIVAAPQQQVTASAQVMIARDAVAHRGPLGGLATGLCALHETRPGIDAVFATGCDFPLLKPAFISYMFALLQDFDAAVPVDDTRRFPLAAVYRPRVLPTIGARVNARSFKAQNVFDEFNTCPVRVDELRSVDPQLHSLRNVNTHADYAEALAIAGMDGSGGWRPTDRRLK